jgi:hypothetical protein
MGVNEHFEAIYNAVSCQLRGFKTASQIPFIFKASDLMIIVVEGEGNLSVVQ